MRKYIVIKTQFEAIHCWPDCDIPAVAFLSLPHRHIFYVVVKWTINDNNREKEFIMQKRGVELFLGTWSRRDIGGMSCEDIAETLLKEFKADFVSVFEDNENGAEIWAE